MRGKFLAKNLLILALLVWSGISLWPTYKMQSMEPDVRARMESEGKLKKITGKAIRLGLDLQGGIYLVYEVDMPSLAEKNAGNRDSRFEELFQKVKEEAAKGDESFIPVLGRVFQEAGIPLHRYWGSRDDSDEKILREMEKESRDALDRAMEKLRNRIDQFGVSEPSIQKIRGNRILIELPGLSNVQQAKDQIGKTALLEFRLLKDPQVYGDVLDRIDKAVAREKGILSADTAASAEQMAVKPKTSQDTVLSVNELFGETDETPAPAATGDSIIVDQNIFQKNPFYALFRNARMQGREVAASVNNIRAIEQILAKPEIQKLIPSDAEFLWSSETFKIGDEDFRELFLVKSEAELTGDHLTDARVTIGSDVKNAGQPVVSFAMDRKGGRDFARITGANLRKRLAIVLDGRIVSAPVINDRIPNGRGVIEGVGKMDEANWLAICLRIGALPANLTIMEERSVGPTLGQDSINRGKTAAIVGTLLVILFMAVYYRLSGLIANIALLLNVFFLLAVLVQFGFTLTMPGIAGIVLTIGMAVDANVLVFERIREELRTGKTVRASIEAGYSRAFSAIIDSNITTLLTAFVLYQFGTGAVKGFAVTLSIGIVVNMFTSLFVTRVIFEHITSRRTLTRLSI
ncbi:protein translocase subunit SecD [bacterium]|nr:protein translocase subunit SecD [bacterium]